MRIPVRLVTADGMTIAASYTAPRAQSRGAVLLLHMMPATKKSYAEFSRMLAYRGFASLSIDFRGHGDSQYGPDGYERFSDEDHQKKINDVEAGVAYLESKGFSANHVALVGASIGANFALQYAAAHPTIPAVVALSPGLNYRGVLTMPAIEGMPRSTRVYLAASSEDADSDATVEKLAERCLAKLSVKHFDGAGHGTTILDREPAFANELIDWIAKSL